MTDSRRRSHWITLGLLVIAAAVLRWLAVPNLVFYGDEYGTLRWIQHPVSEILSRYVIHLTMHLYLLLLKAYAQLAGTSALALKLPSIVAGILLVPVLYGVGRRLVGSPACLVGLALVACNEELIRYSQMARAYSLLVLLITLAAWIYTRLLEAGRPVAALGLAVVGVAALTTSLNAAYFVLVMALHGGLSCVIRRRWRQLFLLVFSLSLIALGSWWFYHPMWGDITVLRQRWMASQTLRGDWIVPAVRSLLGYGWWALLPVAAFGTRTAWHRDRYHTGFLLTWALVPWVIHLYDFNYPTAAYPRYVLFTLPAVLLLAGAGLYDLTARALGARRRGLVLVVAVAAVAAVSLLPGGQLAALRRATGHPYPAAFEHLDQTTRRRDLVICGHLGEEHPEWAGYGPHTPLPDVEGMAAVQPVPSKGRLRILSQGLKTAEERWAQHFTVQVVDPGTTLKPLLVLVGEKGSAGGVRFQELMRHYLEGWLPGLEAGQLDDMDIRRTKRLSKFYAALASLCAQMKDAEGEERYGRLLAEALK